MSREFDERGVVVPEDHHVGFLGNRIRERVRAEAAGFEAPLVDLGAGSGTLGDGLRGLLVALDRLEPDSPNPRPVQTRHAGLRMTSLRPGGAGVPPAQNAGSPGRPGNPSRIVGDVENPPFRPRTFRTALLVNVLVNTPPGRVGALLAGARRLLGAGGVLWTDFRNRAHGGERFRERIAPWLPAVFPEGFHTMRAVDFRFLARRLGFRIDRVVPIGGLTTPRAYLVRLVVAG